MKKSVINFIIDTLMFICMAAIAGIGFLIKYVLVPGSKRWEIYNRNVDLTFMGMDRHEWGEIHLIIAFVLIGFLSLHIILHWNMVFCIYCNMVKKKSPRTIIAIIFIVLCIVLAIVPLFLKPEVHELEAGFGRTHSQNEKNESVIPSDAIDIGTDHHSDSDIIVQGFMTLKEVSESYHIPVDTIKSRLHIKSYISENQKLGWIKKEYHFKMSDIETIIADYQSRK